MSWLKKLLGSDYPGGMQRGVEISLEEFRAMADDMRSLGNNLNHLSTIIETLYRMMENKTDEEVSKNLTFQKVLETFKETLLQIKKQLIFALSLEELMRKNEQKTETAKAAANQPPPRWGKWGARAPPR